ncbi:hypothetical protein [Desulfonema magnum]|nr:hypothetical protein [Desulfonema magnum]
MTNCKSGTPDVWSFIFDNVLSFGMYQRSWFRRQAGCDRLNAELRT